MIFILFFNGRYAVLGILLIQWLIDLFIKILTVNSIWWILIQYNYRY